MILAKKYFIVSTKTGKAHGPYNSEQNARNEAFTFAHICKDTTFFVTETVCSVHCPKPEPVVHECD